MKMWKSKFMWVRFLAILVLGAILYGRLEVRSPHVPDPEVQTLRRLAADGDPSLAEWLDQSLVLIPAGEFIRGTDAGTGNDGPQQIVYLDAFAIDRFEVTNAQYGRFLEAGGGRPPSHWGEGGYPSGQADYPVVGISWEAANAYCDWAGKRLPTEAEWEKACRGTEGNLYPWGDRWEEDLANIGAPGRALSLEHRDGSPTAWAYAWELLQTTPASDMLGLQPVGSYPAGQSPYSVMDMAGNASEWIFDWYNWGDYSGMSLRNPVNLEPPWNRSVRGSAWHNPAGDVDRLRQLSLCTARSSAHSISDPRTGFRCAVSVPRD